MVPSSFPNSNQARRISGLGSPGALFLEEKSVVARVAATHSLSAGRF